MMDNLLLQATLWVVVLFLVYAVLARGLFRAAEPLRQIALDLAVELNASDEMPELDKRVIEMTLGELHSVGTAWGIAAIGVRSLVTWPFRRRRAKVTTTGLSPEVAKMFERYQFYWVICTISNSPAAAAIFLVSSLIATAFSASGGLVSSIFNAGHRNGGGPHHANA